MRLTFTFPVRFKDATSRSEMPAPDLVQDIKLNDESLDNYLDAELADEGVMGGDVYLRCKNGLPLLDVIYWYPTSPHSDLVHLLLTDTKAQLEDGIGEGGFEFDFEGKRLLVTSNTKESGTVDISDDGREVLGPAKIAMAARDGDLSRLMRELEVDPSGVDRLHQGCTALHLAIIYGNSESVKPLLAAGANPNAIDLQGDTPLVVCALCNALDDQKSREIAQMLIEAGGSPNHRTPNGNSARDYAEKRGKRLLAELL